jgi:hypothetical protein
LLLLLPDGLCAVTKQGVLEMFHWNPLASGGSPDQYGDQPFNPRCPFDMTVRSTAFVANSAATVRRLNDTARLMRTARIPNCPICFVCLPPHVYQHAGTIITGNNPDLNAEFGSCTFASNTAGTVVSSLRRICFRSTQPDFVCIDSSVHRPAPLASGVPSGAWS